MPQAKNSEEREKIALRRVTAAARTLSKGTPAAPLVDEISNSYHADPSVRAMRRVEAVATFLDALVGATQPAKAGKAKTTASAEPVAIGGDGESSAQAA